MLDLQSLVLLWTPFKTLLNIKKLNFMAKFPINAALQRIAISGLLKDANVPLTSAFLLP